MIESALDLKEKGTLWAPFSFKAEGRIRTFEVKYTKTFQIRDIYIDLSSLVHIL